ncbi:MAG: Gfo/Idh/MocA family oxidoreductase [Caldilineaceae bacterium]
MSNKPINVGVIGAGGMGGRHVNNLTNEVAAANVVAIMDVDQARLKEVAAACGASHTFTDAQALIEHPHVEAVLIASPDRFHAAQARACIAMGKPVLCEKPLGTTAAEAFQVVEHEAASGRRLVQVGFMREYDPAHRKVKQMIDSDTLGKALAFYGAHINAFAESPRSVDDVISNSAVHDIHSARWMMGDEIATVYTSYIPSNPGQPETARMVFIQLNYRHGAIGQIECNAEADYGYEVDVKMTGERGVVQTNSLRSAVVRQSNQRGQWVEEDWLQRFDAAYINEVRDWVRSLQQGTTTGPSAWDGYVSMVVSDACIASAKSGQAVAVEIPEMPAIYRRG